MNNVIVKNGTENLTELMYEIMEKLKDDCDNTIEFEKGIYKFYSKGSCCKQLFSSGGLNAKNYVVFPIYEKKNLTIEGNGSEFIFLRQSSADSCAML